MLDFLPTLLVGGLYVVVMTSGLGLLTHLQMGLTRMANFGVVGFWGFGLYVFGVSYTQIEWPFGDPFQFLAATALATIAAGLAGLLISWIIADLDVDGALVGTLGFAGIVLILATTLEITEGARGLRGIRFPFDAGNSSSDEFVWLLVTTAVVIGIFFYARWVHRSPYGRLLIAIGSNEPLARSLGKSTTRAKLLLFSTTSALMGLLGAMQAVMFRFVAPFQITVVVTLAVLTAMILGGTARVWGPVIGTLIIVGFFDVFLQFYVSVPADWPPQALPVGREAVFGLVLMLVLVFRPRGILGNMNRPKMMRKLHDF